MSWKRIDLSVYATTVIAVSSFLPWVDTKWITTGCVHGGSEGGVLSVVGIVGWLAGATLLTVSLVRARRDGRTWRDLMLLPAFAVSVIGIVLLLGVAWSRDCGGGFVG
jgi:hypothetical protein